MIRDCKDFNVALKFAHDDWIAEHNPDSVPTTFQDGTEIMCNAMKILLVSKNHKYGKQNILKFGQQGIFIRDWDKICRLEEGIMKDVDLGEEGLLETWADNAGYSLVAMLLEKDWYKLPVETS
jgi:hypothetical protein